MVLAEGRAEAFFRNAGTVEGALLRALVLAAVFGAFLRLPTVLFGPLRLLRGTHILPASFFRLVALLLGLSPSFILRRGTRGRFVFAPVFFFLGGGLVFRFAFFVLGPGSLFSFLFARCGFIFAPVRRGLAFRRLAFLRGRFGFLLFLVFLVALVLRAG